MFRTFQNPAISRFARQVTLLLSIALCTSSTHASEVINVLGLSSGLNLVSFGNFDVPSSDVEGRVAVGGNATMTSYSINTKNGTSVLYSGTGLTVGGNLTFIGGVVGGNGLVGGNLIMESTAGFTGTVQSNQASNSLGFDFAAEQARLKNLSMVLDGLPNVGTAGLVWSTLSLDANGNSLAVFDLESADMLNSMELTNLVSGGTVLINVHGQTVNFTNHGYGNFMPGHVLFNLVDATTVTFEGGVSASFLAPLANFITRTGEINGQVVVANWSGSAQVNDAPFSGEFSTVPEPGTGSLILFGLVAITLLSYRNWVRDGSVRFAAV